MRLQGQRALITGASRPALVEAKRDRTIEPAEVAWLITWICSAPEHVSIGNVTIWPLAAAIKGVDDSASANH